MKRFPQLLIALPAFCLVAGAQTQEAASPAPAAPAATAQAAPETSVPSDEQWLTGWIEFGYRFNSGPNGSLSTYRSVVNLGAGPKLTGLDFTFTNLNKHLVDSIRVRASDWTDPYSTLNVYAAKERFYHFTASYRSLAYFNDLPSYADPLLSRGIQLDEQSFDSRRHITSMELQFAPGRMISPYLGFDHDGATTQGTSAFQTGDNEYAVPYTQADVGNQYRGGINVALPRLHLTLEEGGNTWKSNENVFATGLNTGNSSSVILGQTLDVNTLLQAWGVRGSGQYSRAALTASPLSWLEVFGHFGYSDPHNSVNYSQIDGGNLLLLSQVLFYNGEQFLLSAATRMPHTSGDAGTEMRFGRFRVDQHWTTDRMHNSGSSSGTDTLYATGTAASLESLTSAFSALFASNYNEYEAGVAMDVTTGIRVRGAYRRVWGDGGDLVLPQAGLITVQTDKLSRNVALGSASWRVSSKLLVAADFELGRSGSEYYRTSLYNYSKARVTGRYDLSSTARLSVDYRVLSNQNPLAGSPYKYFSHQESAALQWTPRSVKNTSFDAVYEHCGYRTQMSYLDPTYLVTTISNYREYCHDVSATANITLPKAWKRAKLSAGGSALLTSGSRPTQYYQPTARLTVPLTGSLGWFALWQYYGFAENFYGFENFQTHLFTTGLRYSK